MKVKFIKCSDEQAQFGGGVDPRKYLVLNKVYEVVNKEVHSWYTMYYLKGFPSFYFFNSVCFEEVK